MPEENKENKENNLNKVLGKFQSIQDRATDNMIDRLGSYEEALNYLNTLEGERREFFKNKVKGIVIDKLITEHYFFLSESEDYFKIFTQKTREILNVE